MEIRRLRKAEESAAMELVWRVFRRFEAPEYGPEGIRTFQTYIMDPAAVSALMIYGAFDKDAVIGILAIRADAHISLFFVDPAWYRKGVGKALFCRFLTDSGVVRVTVNASPYAVGVYRRLGFCATAPEQITDGIRYTPMLYDRTEKGG